MDFTETIYQFSFKASNLKSHLQSEHVTKISLIMPFFQILDYDVFNPTEFFPEYVADFGIKKGEKVDYVIIRNKNPRYIVLKQNDLARI